MRVRVCICVCFSWGQLQPQMLFPLLFWLLEVSHHLSMTTGFRSIIYSSIEHICVCVKLSVCMCEPELQGVRSLVTPGYLTPLPHINLLGHAVCVYDVLKCVCV